MRGWNRIFVSLFALMLLVPATAGAHTYDDDEDSGSNLGDILLFGGLSTVGDIGGLVTMTGLSVNIGLDERPGTGWLVSGGVFGAMQILGGTGLLLQDDCTETNWFGALTIAGGVVNLGLVIGGALMPEPGEPVVRVAPLGLVDAEGELAPGIGLTVVGF